MPALRILNCDVKQLMQGGSVARPRPERYVRNRTAIDYSSGLVAIVAAAAREMPRSVEFEQKTKSPKLALRAGENYAVKITGVCEAWRCCRSEERRVGKECRS